MTYGQTTIDVSTAATPPRAQTWLMRGRAILERWLARSRSRDELAAMDERMLLDIGRTRADALRESAKHFWQR